MTSFDEINSRIEGSDANWVAKETPLTLLSTAQKRRLLGVVVDRADLAAAMARRPRSVVPNFAPAIDWRANNGNHISPVKDQGSCGSCVSFCTVSTVESMASIELGQKLDLSEADLHFCSDHGANCQGWWPHEAYNALITRGAPDEDCFPYSSAFTSGYPSCIIGKNRDARAVRITESTTINTMVERKNWLTNVGPVSAVIHVYEDFYSYGSGIYKHVTGEDQGLHCIEVIGYSDAEKCWICKNSWGTQWGDNGFFKIGYGEAGIDTEFPFWTARGVKIPATEAKRIPGWFGAENQGAGIAIADLNRNGRPDLIVFHIDNPSGQNRGYYRIGWNLDTKGNVTGGWSEMKQIPGSFGAENQGAGIAIADLNGNGRPDLIVFHIDNPSGENRGYYRIGFNLDSNGNATNWSEVKPIPGWFGKENQGGGVAIGDINGNGRPDLIVFHIDNPSGENRGYYRIGWNLDANGNAAGGWTDVKQIPQWFGWENQGAGIAIANVNNRPRLVVFHIDNPKGENTGYYRISQPLDSNGNVTGQWNEVKPIPGWFGWENQEGDIAIADINGNNRPDLVVFNIDNPKGENSGYYRIVWDIL